jgi:hypothetical protein
MHNSETKPLNPHPNKLKNTNKNSNTTRNTTHEVVPRQPSTSTQRKKNKPTQPPITVTAIAKIIVLFALAFKKGYITIEVVDLKQSLFPGTFALDLPAKS